MADPTLRTPLSVTGQVPVVPTPPAPEPIQQPQQETVVVPTGQIPPASQFIPTVPGNGGFVVPQTTAPTVPRRGTSCIGRIMRILVVFIVLGALGALGWFGYTYFAGNRQVTITYWGLWENEATMRMILDDFEREHPNIKVEYFKQSPKQYRERLAAAIERGDGPDVFRFHNTWVPMLVNQLAPVPGAVMSPENFISTFYPVAKNDLIAGGSTIYGLPIMIDGLGLYVNEDLFAAAGASPPTSWEDIIKTGGLVEKLTVREGETIVTSAISLGTSTNVEHFSDILAVMMMQNGAKLTDPTSEEAEGTLLFYRRFADPNDPLFTWSQSFDSSVPAFANGRVAMILAPSWRAFDIKQINPSLNFKIVPIPQLSGNTVNYASYWVEGVSVESKLQPQAWEFVKYLTGKEAATKLYAEAAKTRLFGEPYALVEMGKLVENDPFVGAYIKQAPMARSFPLASRTGDNGINDKLIKYLEDAVTSVNSGSSPKDALKTYASGMQQVFSQYGLSVSSVPAN
ncbi:hypothetical protein A2Z33_03100 [Candidatus Gottesmanbacteria bacterium RBG_16_52_11]|uniref:ABC transporter substrate-binding protein n=1 Tax=Candidatus Gottesmanbacteria bacterium RBG_16_52_11 TaxID=1798374 RepID=A0A1F5YVI0_9BACT|nr:MAG: hypothetical protein A2Z33_03100 [Candidatus Gottesmanbacteria bacterium RBG_16_52_11]